MTRLSDLLQIVYITAHWAFAFKSLGGMIAMTDLIYLLKNRKDVISWEVILKWLDGSIVATYFYLMLTYLTKYRLADIPPEILYALARQQRSFGSVNLGIMHALMDRYIVHGPPVGRLASTYHLETIWQTLLSAGTPLSNLLRVPWSLLMGSRLRSDPSKLARMLLARLASRRLPVG